MADTPKKSSGEGELPDWAAPFLVLIFLLPLLCGHLSSWPPTWYDEGEFLLTAKTYFQDGIYGIRLGDGYLRAHPSVGPSLLIPIAWMMNLLEPTVLAGRAVMVAFSLMTLFLASRLAKLSGERLSAPFAAAFMFLNPFCDFFYYSRLVSGEIPALAFLFLGFLFWAKRVRGWSVAAGVLFGLAITTKPHALLVLPAVAAAELWEWRVRQRTGRFAPVLVLLFIGALIPCCALVFSANSVGWELYWRQMRELRGVLDLVLITPPKHSLGTIRHYLGCSSFLFLTGFSYWYQRPDVPEEQRAPMRGLLLFSVSCQLWYCFFAPAWARYAILGQSTGIIFVARTAAKLLANKELRAKWMVKAAFVALAALEITQISRSIYFKPLETGAQDVANFINTHLPEGSIIATYEWEIGFLSRYPIVQPALDAHYKFLKKFMDGTPLYEDHDPGFEFWKRGATHVIVGPMSLGFGAFPEAELRRRARMIFTSMPYDLYEVNAP